MRRTRVLAITAAALIVTLTACSGSSDDDLASTATVASAPAMETSYAAAATSAAETAAASSVATAPGLVGDAENVKPGPGGESAPGAPTTVVRGRVATGREDIIKIASLTVEAADVDQTRNEAATLANGLGADVSSETSTGTGKEKSATMVFRVLPADFDTLVTGLGKLGHDGEIVSRDVKTEDVTGQVADIEGRIGAAKDSAEKIRALIARADKITDLVTLEREYQARDAEIQSMASQLASLKDRAGRSTVTFNIRPLPPKAKEPVAPKKAETGFMAGLKAGWRATSATTVVLATAVGALLPLIVLTGVALLAWWIVRRRRSSATPALEPAGHPSGSF